MCFQSRYWYWLDLEAVPKRVHCGKVLPSQKGGLRASLWVRNILSVNVSSLRYLLEPSRKGHSFGTAPRAPQVHKFSLSPQFLTCEANSAKCPHSHLSLPILDSFTSSLHSIHNLSWGEFDKTKLREPKEPGGRRERETSEEGGKNSVIYLTLFINFPFLALVTRLQR